MGKHTEVILGAFVALALALALAVPVAGARSGTPSSGPAGAGAPSTAASGGASYDSPRPRVTGVRCRTSCPGPRRAARPGSVVRITGRGLASSRLVRFRGGKGVRDDAVTAPARATRAWVEVVVPRAARSGRLAVTAAGGRVSRSSPRAAVRIEQPPPRAQQPTRPAADGTSAIEAEVAARAVFFGSSRPATLVYVVHGAEPSTVTISLVRLDDGVEVASWTQEGVAPDTRRTVSWDGRAGGAVQREGSYEFRVTSRSAGAQASTAPSAPGAAPSPASFTFLRDKFPVRGRHAYGDGLGAGRGHQGADVMAACGTPLVAARAGVVKLRQYHARAGNYLVVDADGTGDDYVYMHLRDPAPFDKGDRIATGQRIGAVGQTGSASACHLHFELWAAPGWYTGGSPIDPVARLRAWDARS